MVTDELSTVSQAPASERATVRRIPDRASYERERADAILDEGLVAHVGLTTENGPVVIPMLYARDGDRLLLHGSPASRLLRTAGAGTTELCVAVTLLDGLVLARSAFHHSMNYRSVVVFGKARRIEDLTERRAALDRLVEALIPGRGPDVRPPSEKEVRGTTVLELPLDELSVKVRTGEPLDEDEDYDLPVWAGVVPLTSVPGEPIPDPALHPDAPPVPAYALNYSRARR